MGSDFVKQSHK